MTIVFVLVPLAFLLASLAVAAFVWSARQGQLDDLVTPALRILNDDDPEPGIPLARTKPEQSPARPGDPNSATRPPAP